MENKIHDDQLNDYVRKSFEDYEESPSPGMWERIEGDLPPAIQPPRVSLFRRYRWQTAAAAVIVLLISSIVCERFYYEKKIQALSAEKDKIQELTKEKIGDRDVFSEKHASQHQENEETQPPQATNFPKLDIRNLENRPAILEQKFVPPFGGENTKFAGDEKEAIPNHLPIIQPEENAAKNLLSLSKSDALSQTNEAITEFTKPADVELLTTLSLPVKSSNLLATPSCVALPIKPVREQSGWFIGLHVTPHFTFDNAQTPIRRPGGRPIFVSRQESPSFSADWWLKAGKKLNARFALESGVGYSEMSRTATHTPRFRFSEGIVGGASFRRNFAYDLSTYGGSAAVSLRMEQVDSDPVQDDEPISLKIKTSEHAQLLRVPLLLAYRLGTGRLHGVVKAGLTGNFFLKNELDIFAQYSQNSRFRPVQGSDSYTIQLEKQGKFFLGYCLSAGGEFHLNRHIGLIAEPSFYGDFPRNDAAGRRLPSHFSLGLNVGANYYF